MAKNNCGKLLLEMKTFSEEFAERCKTNNENGECVVEVKVGYDRQGIEYVTGRYCEQK